MVGVMLLIVFSLFKYWYFGKKGFSDYMDNVYWVNVLKYMWIVVCCRYKVKWVWKYYSMVFKRENNLGMELCVMLDIGKLL